MKKIMSIFLSCTVAFVMLAGCSSNSAPSSGAPAPAPASPSAGAPAPSQEKKVDYPKQPIELIVPANPGGDTDINARQFAEYFSQEIGQTVVVVNVAGAGGSTATRQVKDAAGDGYQLLFFHPNVLIGMITGIVDYDFFEEFKLLALPTSDSTTAFVVGKNCPYNTLNDLVADAKARPGKVSVALEIGSIGHFNALELEQAAGIDLNIVDGGTTSEKIPSLLGGKFDCMTATLPSISDYIASGEMKVLGVMSAERIPKWDSIPTCKEQGIDLVYSKNCFVAANKNTPDEICDIIEQAAVKALQNPEYIKEAMDKYAIAIQAVGREEGTAEFKSQYEELKQFSDIFNKK